MFCNEHRRACHGGVLYPPAMTSMAGKKQESPRRLLNALGSTTPEALTSENCNPCYVRPVSTGILPVETGRISEPRRQ